MATQLRRISSPNLAIILLAISLFLFVFLQVLAEKAYAANPQIINFQGKVTNLDGTNVANGNYNFDFILYDDPTAGTNRWQESWNTGTSQLTVTNGIFQVPLGTHTALPNFNTYPNLYLAIRFNNDAAGYMTPRVRLTSVPYALNSDALQGFSASNFIQLAQGLQADSSSAQPSIAVNKTGNTADILQLQKSGVNALVVNNSGHLVLGQAGTSGANGTLVFSTTNASNTTITLQAASTAASYSLTLPTSGPSTSQCLQTDSVTASQLIFGSCGSGGSGDLQAAYNADSSGMADIVTTSSSKGVLIRAGSTFDSTALFQIQNSNNGNLLNIDSSLSNITLLGNNDGQTGPWTNQATNRLPAIRYRATSVIANGYVYVLGGFNNNDTVFYAKLNADGSTGPWTNQATNKLPAGRDGATSVVANGYVYVIGGYNGSNPTDTVFYAKLNADGSTGPWTNQATNRLPANRDGATSVVANGYVYVFGGYSGTTYQDTVFYAKLNADGSTGPWTDQSSNKLPAGRQSATSAVANGYVYVIGGYNGSSQDTVFYAKLNADGSTGPWTNQATNKLPAIRSSASSVVANGYVYVFGGTTQNTVFYAKLNADGSTGPWTNQATNRLPANRDGATSVVANGYVYVIGGYNGSSQDTVFYASLSRLKIGSSLDLFSGSGGQTLSDSSASGTLTAGNTSVLGSLDVRDQANFTGSVGVGGALTVNGHAYIKSIQGSTDIFNIQNSGGLSLININTVNLLANTNFENATTGVLPDGWAAKGSSFVTTDNTQSLFGSNSMRVSASVANDGAKYNYNFLPYTQYSLSLYAKVASGSISDFVVGRQETGVDSNCLSAQTVTTTWTRFTCTFTTGSLSGTNSIYVQKSASNGIFFIDGVQLERSAAATDYRNGDVTFDGRAVFRNLANSSTAFQIQNSAGTNALTVNTTTNTVTVSNLTVSGTCTGCGATLSASYNGSGTSGNTITLTQSGAGIVVADASSAITGSSLFTVQNNAGSSKYLNIASSGVSVLGAGASSFTTSSGALTLTSAAAATWSTTSGNLIVQAGSGTVSLGSSTNLTSSGALTVAAAASNALTLTSNSAATWSTSSGNLTINSGGGTLVFGTNTNTLQRAATAFSIDLATAATSTLTVTNSNGSNVANLSVEGEISIGSGQVYKVGSTSGSTISVCGAGEYVASFASSGGLVTGGTCTSLPTSGATSLDDAYNQTSNSGNTITLTAAGDGIIIQDAATTVGGNLFAVQENLANGGALLFAVTTTGFTVENLSSEDALTLDTSSATPQLRVHGDDETEYAVIYYDSATNTAFYGASNGTAVLGSGTGAVSIASGAGTGINIDAANGTILLGSNTTTLQRQATSFTIDLNDASASTLTVTNASAGVASISLEAGGSYTSTGAITLSSGGSSNLTVNSAGGTLIAGISTTTLQKSGSSFVLDVSNGASNSTLTVSNSGGAGNITLQLDSGGSFAVGASTGTSASACGAGQFITGTLAGGIVSGGSCSAATLQTAYDASTTPATITTTSGKGVLIRAGASADNEDLFVVQNAAGTNFFQVDTENSIDQPEVQIGSSQDDASTILFGLDGESTFTETATCNSTYGGTMYYNITSNAIRACIGSTWEDLISTTGMGILAFGVIIDTGSNPGDLASLQTSGASGPCKVSYLSATQVRVAPCSAYSGGRKVVVSQTDLTLNTTTTNRWSNVCLSGTDSQPTLVGPGNAQTASNINPTFSINNPILCLATVQQGTASNGSFATGGNIFDARTFTGTTKVYATTAAAMSIGYVAQATGANVTTSTNTLGTAGQRGVVVATNGAAAASNAPNAILAISGPAYVKAIGGTAGQNIHTSGTTAFVTTSTTTTYGPYAYLGVSRTTFSSTCTSASTCLGSLYTDLTLR